MSRVGRNRNRTPLRSPSPSTREADGRRSGSTALTTAIVHNVAQALCVVESRAAAFGSYGGCGRNCPLRGLQEGVNASPVEQPLVAFFSSFFRICYLLKGFLLKGFFLLFTT